MAELLWRRREVVTVLPSHVGTDAAALAPPLVSVSSQAAENINNPISDDIGRIPSLTMRRWRFFVFLPGLDVLRHDAPRQVVVTVVTSWVVKEIRPGGEDVARQPRASLWDHRYDNTYEDGSVPNLRNKAAYFHLPSYKSSSGP